jgi:hypothetical protein
MSAALATIAGRIAPIGLQELNARAALQTRVDSKYVLDLDRFDALVGMLVEELQILQIDGAQEQTYDTMYFDTVGLGCFRDHLQRRWQTYKLRTRVYVGSGLHVFEVKMRDGRGHTVKVKIDHRDCHPHVIGPAATAFYRESIRDWYGFDVPDTFVPSLRNQYDRITWSHGPAPNAPRSTTP